MFKNRGKVGGIILLMLVSISLLLVACSQTGLSTPPTTSKATISQSTPTTSAAPSLTGSFKITLKAATALASSHIITKAGLKFFDLVNSYTNGAVTIQNYPNSSLVKYEDQLDAVRNDIVDISHVAASYTPGETPLTGAIPALPFLYSWDNYAQVNQALEPLYEDEFEALGVKYIPLIPPYSMEWYLNFQIDPNNPNLDGKKIRSYGPEFTTILQILGGNPITMPSTEQAVSLSTKVIDGTNTSLASADSMQLIKSAHYIYIAGMLFGQNPWIINGKVWNSLPKDIQDAIMRAANDANSWALATAQSDEQAIIDKWKKDPSLTVTTLTPAQRDIWRQKLSPVYDSFKSKFGDKATQVLAAAQK